MYNTTDLFHCYSIPFSLGLLIIVTYMLFFPPRVFPCGSAVVRSLSSTTLLTTVVNPHASKAWFTR